MTRQHLTLHTLIGAVCFAMAAIASATKCPVSVVAHDAICHPSPQEAAAAGIHAAAALSTRVEYGGAVYQQSADCFVHSMPVTSNRPNDVKYVIQRVRSRLLVGIYHTHTPGTHALEFSRHDREVQQQIGVPSYMGAVGFRSGEVSIQVLR